MNLSYIYKQLEEMEIKSEKKTIFKIGIFVSFFSVLVFYVMIVLDFLFLIVQHTLIVNGIFNFGLCIFGFVGYPAVIIFIKNYFQKRKAIQNAKKLLHHFIYHKEEEFLLELDFAVNFCLEKNEDCR
jgi:hypothetical protein